MLLSFLEGRSLLHSPCPEDARMDGLENRYGQDRGKEMLRYMRFPSDQRQNSVSIRFFPRPSW